MTRMILGALVLAIGAPLAACGGAYGGSTGSVCATNEDCGGEVCTRTHECLPADEVRRVMTHWTINTQAASATACTDRNIDHLEIQYTDASTGESVGYAPVPCGQGQFLVDVWPTRYNDVQLEAYSPGHSQIAVAWQDLGRTGDVDVTIDLSIPIP